MSQRLPGLESKTVTEVKNNTAAMWQKKHTLQWAFKRNDSTQPLPESDSNTLSFAEFSQVIGLHPLVALFFNLDDCNKAQVAQLPSSTIILGNSNSSSSGGSPNVSSPLLGPGRDSSVSVSAQNSNTGAAQSNNPNASPNTAISRTNSLVNLPTSNSETLATPISGSLYLSRQFQMLQ
jgi:hypothetical protein